jgi:hypothetical protein
MQKYFGNWSSYQDLVNEFGRGDYDYDTSSYLNVKVDEDFPTDDEIIFASSEEESYSGWCHVVYEKDGKLYEYEDSHCSCDGLSWNPEETTWAALALRMGDIHDEVLRNLIAKMTMTRRQQILEALKA